MCVLLKSFYIAGFSQQHHSVGRHLLFCWFKLKFEEVTAEKVIDPVFQHKLKMKYMMVLVLFLYLVYSSGVQSIVFGTGGNIQHTVGGDKGKDKSIQTLRGLATVEKLGEICASCTKFKHPCATLKNLKDEMKAFRTTRRK